MEIRLLPIILSFFALFHGGESRTDLIIERHYKCGDSIAPYTPKIIFPDGVGREVYKTEESNCKAIVGSVDVRDRLRVNQLEIAFRVHVGTQTAYPQMCHNPEPNGCGGIGSCVACDVCDAAREARKEYGYQLVSLRRNGRKVRCKRPIQPGNYTDLALRVCLPPLDDILKTLDEDKDRALQIWEDIVTQQGGRQGEWKQNRRGGERYRDARIVLYAWIFDEPIHHLNFHQIQDRITGRDGEEKSGLIGCHVFHTKLREYQ